MEVFLGKHTREYVSRRGLHTRHQPKRSLRTHWRPIATGSHRKLEVALPSPRKETSGAFLRTRGHVVRSEQLGFAAVAEMGFRMQFPDTHSSRNTSENSGDHEDEHQASRKEVSSATPSRFWM